MNMNSIAEYMYFSRAIDLTPEKRRFFRLPDSGVRRTVLMVPNRAVTFALTGSRRMAGI